MKRSAVKIKAIIIISVLILSTIMTTGCIYTGYRGDYPELCSVAWANLITSRGHSSNGEALFDPNLSILETDSFGRVLFGYSEDRITDTHLLIMQKSDGERAYYYPEDCYIFAGRESELTEIDLESNAVSLFKELNDWNLPINEAKCDSTEIIRKKSEGKIKPNDAKLESIAEEFYISSGRYVHPKNVSFVSYSNYVTSDDYGRELHLIITDFTEYYDKSEITYYYDLLAVIMPDGSCDVSTVVLLEDIENPQEVIKKIKTDNGWDTPIN
ncbi:MAG: hypothetical protein IJX97_06760 [Clostridia bacterium]|nr:hypothetical protein [Clostridia bacterium]